MPIRFNPQDFDSEVPQEGWDEPVREEEKTWKHTILNIGKGIVALMIIAGLLYFSGIYQGTLFQSTPPSAQRDHSGTRLPSAGARTTGRAT